MTYVVLAITASLALHAPLGMTIGFVTALIVALAKSHGSVPERVRQTLRMAHLRAMTAFAVVALVTHALDDWKIAAIAWLIAAFATGAWRTHGRLTADNRWALLSRFAGAAAGLAMAWLNHQLGHDPAGRVVPPGRAGERQRAQSSLALARPAVGRACHPCSSAPHWRPRKPAHVRSDRECERRLRPVCQPTGPHAGSRPKS